MRHHPRRPLPDKVLRALSQWQRLLDAEWSTEQQRPADVRRAAGELAESHWVTHRQTKALEAIEFALAAMASPEVARCMYCEHDRGCQIDHAEPKAHAHHRTFAWENHVWACGNCNQKKTALYHPQMVIPTDDDPLEHLDLVPSGRWTARDDSPRGTATLQAMPFLNDQLIVQARARGRRTVIDEIDKLAQRASVTQGELDALREKVTRDPFSDVFAALLSTLRLPGATAFVAPRVVEFVRAHPEMHGWLADDDEQRWRDAWPAIERAAAAMRLRLDAASDDQVP